MFCVHTGTRVHHMHACVVIKPNFFSLVCILQAASDKKPLVAQRDSSHHGSHIVGREETQFVVETAGPPRWVGAIQDFNHLPASESQLIFFQSLEVIQCPGPAHSLEGSKRQADELSRLVSGATVTQGNHGSILSPLGPSQKADLEAI